MICQRCYRDPRVDRISLIRQNQKGVSGEWLCEDCNMKPVDKELQAVIDYFVPKKPRKVN